MGLQDDYRVDRFRNLPLVLAVLVVLISAAPAGASNGKKWAKKLRAAERLVLTGDYSKARQITIKVAEGMTDAMGPGDLAVKALGTVLTLRGLAESGLGNRRDALWYWHVALNLSPDLAEYDLERYGALGAFLRDNPLPPLPATRERPDHSAAGGGRPASFQGVVSPPRPRTRPAPRYPRGAAAFGLIDGKVVVEVLISVDGSVSHPRILEAPPAPTMSYAVLEAVRQWEFEPARRHGEPVSVYYNLTVNLKFER